MSELQMQLHRERQDRQDRLWTPPISAFQRLERDRADLEQERQSLAKERAFLERLRAEIREERRALSYVRQGRVPKKVKPLIEAVADATDDVSVSDILSGIRSPSVTRVRQFAMYLVKKQLGLSLNELRYVFDRRDHTTILHAVRRTEERIAAGTLPPALLALVPKEEG